MCFPFLSTFIISKPFLIYKKYFGEETKTLFCIHRLCEMCARSRLKLRSKGIINILAFYRLLSTQTDKLECKPHQ